MKGRFQDPQGEVACRAPSSELCSPRTDASHAGLSGRVLCRKKKNFQITVHILYLIMLILPFNFENGSDFSQKGLYCTFEPGRRASGCRRAPRRLRTPRRRDPWRRAPPPVRRRKTARPPLPMSMRRHSAGSSTATRRHAAQARPA